MKHIAFVSILVLLVGCGATPMPKDTSPPEDPSVKPKAGEDGLSAAALKRKEAIANAIDAFRTAVNGGAPEQEVPDRASARETLLEAGTDGALALKEALRALDAEEKEDDGFKMAASLLLWEIGGVEEAQAIGEIWDTIPLTIDFGDVFWSTLAAAKTSNPDALPMLEASLKSRNGAVFIPKASMRIAWPLTSEILWGTYGPDGHAVLGKILKTSQNTTAIAAAIRILSKAGHLEALPEMRHLAKTGLGRIKLEALMALGRYGHPDDFEILISELSSDRPDYITTAIDALKEYGDLRATEYLIPLTVSDQPVVRSSALSGMFYLLTPDALAAAHTCRKRDKDPNRKQQCRGFVDAALKELDLTWPHYAAKKPEDKKTLVLQIHNKRQADYQHQPGDDPPEGMDALLKARAALYARVSMKSFEDVDTFNERIKHLSRRRYRETPGICDGVIPTN